MIVAATVAFWFLCGILAIYLAFASARNHGELFEPIHVWLALLGPVGLALACFTLRDWSPEPSARAFPLSK